MIQLDGHVPAPVSSSVTMYIGPSSRGSGDIVTREQDNSAGQETAEQNTSESADSASNQAYWRANLKLGAVLLIIWFVVSFGFGILLVEPLNKIPFFGFKLGFWWAQQGAIYVFIVLIFVYARAMKRLDRKYDVHDD
jgi:putative solute:sodium symporter small subunit